MRGKKNISKSKELMRISMECLPLGAFSGGLYLDLFSSVTAVFTSHKCESDPNKPAYVEELKDCPDERQSQ